LMSRLLQSRSGQESRLAARALLAVTFVLLLIGCGKEQGMYEGSEVSATITVFAFYLFSFVCIVGSLVRSWGFSPLLAGVFVLLCCTVMLLMTPYLWFGLVALVVGLFLGYIAFRRLRSKGKDRSQAARG